MKMTLQPLAWSDPSPAGYRSINADDGVDLWRITPVPRDVTRIVYQGRDPDGTLVCGSDYAAYAESQEEAKIVVELLRAGTDHLRGWREQLERSEEHTSELQSLMRISYAVFCLKKKTTFIKK